MRPRKQILLVDRDSKRRGIHRFILDNWGYAVTDVQDEFDVAAYLADPDCNFHLIVGFGSLDGHFFSEIAARRGVPSLLVRDTHWEDVFACSNRTLVNPTMAEVLEAVRTMAKQKTGPKPGKKAPARVEMPVRKGRAA